jgi:NhaC family Na+:H+ antiporter
MSDETKLPHPLVATLPVVVLIGLLAVVIFLFGSDSLSGGSQVALLMGTAVCVFVSMVFYRTSWRTFENQFMQTIGGASVTLLILLTVGMIAGSWMISGVVPTLIYYGVQILSPKFFLFCTCIICSFVSLLSGSSWTTIATIGVALMGIGQALGVSEAWTAGAIISGAYFGDKMSPLSDTTILASSSTGTDLFTHIKYMTRTTIPTYSVTLLIFLVAGFLLSGSADVEVIAYTKGLSETFNISLWTLIVPLLTGVLIARKVPSLITLFISALMAGVTTLVLQPHILQQIAGDDTLSLPKALTHGLAVTYYGSTAIDTGNASLNEFISTSGMSGMLDTIWLILCAMCFGGVMQAGGFLDGVSRVFLKFVRKTLSLVTSTVLAGLVFNIITADQYISIILTGGMFKQTYQDQGCEARLLSRTTEDAVTVTSPLIPWNTCGMTQASVLGVSTWTYLPYSVFNYLCPLFSILIAATGLGIVKKMRQ